MATLTKPPPRAELSMFDIMSGFTTNIGGIDFLVTQSLSTNKVSYLYLLMYHSMLFTAQTSCYISEYINEIIRLNERVKKNAAKT